MFLKTMPAKQVFQKNNIVGNVIYYIYNNDFNGATTITENNKSFEKRI